MLKQKGINTIAVMILIASSGMIAIGLLVAMNVGVPTWKNYKKINQNTVIVKCVGGYQHAVSQYNITQIINSEGKGIACN